MHNIRVVIHGAMGKMGRETVNAVCREPDLEPVGAADHQAQTHSYSLPDGSGDIPFSNSLKDVINKAQVVVDFSTAEGAMNVIRTATSNKVNVVVGSTGLTTDNIKESESLAQKYQVGIIIAPNFAIGAILMIQIAKIAAPYFDYADLMEIHHEAKIDAPSGTALAIAKQLSNSKKDGFTSTKTEKENLSGTRGGVYEGINIHSGRLPGKVAYHELIFGALGQTLTIRHDSINRESFMPGVVMAIREVVKKPRMIVGLENILKF